MLRALFDLAPRALTLLPPEQAHELTLRSLELGLFPAAPADADSTQNVQFCGLALPNPIGIAAGFDKDGRVPDATLRLGCGFAEIGTVTPLPQPGNPTPRVFRLIRDRAVINRLGFNNDGAMAVLGRLAARTSGGIVGVNIGANKNTEDRAADYVQLIEAFAPVASFFTVNVSSPNTPGLRELQQAAALDDLLARVVEARDGVSKRAGPTPVLLKIAPDLSLADLDDLVGVARARRVDGMIVSNTTIARPVDLRDGKAKEPGGLSGRPLFTLSTRMLAEAYVRAEGAFALIGAGGIDSGASALAKIKAGANLLQLYSGLIFRGLGLVAEIKAEIVKALRPERGETLTDLVGVDAAAVTAEPFPGVSNQ
jgi:dihydroorotate dehydrogenase